MLKTTGLPDMAGPEIENDNNEVVGFGDGGNGEKLAKRSEKLSKNLKSSKLGNLKGKNSIKSKKPSKSRNSPNFDAKETDPSFFNPEARAAFNRLWLAFTKAPILQHFDPKWHIWIMTDVSAYAIGGLLSQLASGTNLDGVVTKADLGQWHPVAFFLGKWFLQKLSVRPTTASV